MSDSAGGGPFRRATSLIAALACGAALLAGCGAPDAAARAIGDPERGAELVENHGCGSCHIVPGRASGIGLVGPPLAGMGARTIIAGKLANTPENMIRWLQDPQEVVPGNVMPDMGLSRADARDITAYLYTLR
jgi:cytochrome c2